MVGSGSGLSVEASPLELGLGSWVGAEVKAKPRLLQLGRGMAGVG